MKPSSPRAVHTSAGRSLGGSVQTSVQQLSVQDRIVARVRAEGRGAVHVPADFLDLGSRAAVDQALSRLTRAGVLRRVARGVYDWPSQHPRLGLLSPSLPRVAAALARSTGAQLQVSGAQAANQLGLSTQVPATLLYLTDGPSRRVPVAGRTITFRHVAPRTLAGAGTMAGLVMQAFRHLGRAGLTAPALAQVRASLRDEDRAALRAHHASAPAWMRPALAAVAAHDPSTSAA